MEKVIHKFPEFIFMFVVTTAIVLAVNFGHGIPYRMGGVSLFDGGIHLVSKRLDLMASTPDLLHAFGGSDYGSYIKGGYSLIENGYESTMIGHGFRMWTPGMYFIYAAIIKIYPDAPLPLLMVLLSCALWAVVLTSFVGLMRRVFPGSFPFAVGAALVFTALPIISRALLWDLVMLSESIAVPLMFLGCVGLARLLLIGPSRGTIALSGLSFLAATLVRANVLLAAIALLVFSIFYVWFQARRENKPPLKTSLGLVAIAIIIAVPVGAYISDMNQLSGANFIWPESWKVEEKAVGTPSLSDIKSEKMNYYAVINPEKADEFSTRIKSGEKISDREYIYEALKTSITHFLPFFHYRANVFWANIVNFSWDGYLLVFSMIGAVAMVLRSPVYGGMAVVGVIFFAAGVVGPSIWYHFEYRYVVPLGMLIYSIPFIEAVIRLSQSRKRI